MEETTTTPYEVKLEVFEGPLDLLLHLIKKNEINIYDIPIALITTQYLEYLSILKSLNLAIAGEFLVMAATLIHIKSKTLLPPVETEEDEIEEDPRAELVRRLVEYKQFKKVADDLGEKEKVWQNIFWKGPTPIPVSSEEEDVPPLEVNLFDLLDAFKDVLERTPETHSMAITIEELSVKDKMNFILDEIEREKSLAFIALFEREVTRMAIIVTFLALLELVRLGLVKAMQVEAFGPIRLFQGEGNKDGG